MLCLPLHVVSRDQHINVFQPRAKKRLSIIARMCAFE